MKRLNNKVTASAQAHSPFWKLTQKVKTSAKSPKSKHTTLLVPIVSRFKARRKKCNAATKGREVKNTSPKAAT